MDALWLQKQFEDNKGKSKAALARALGLEPPAISKILNGTRQIKAQEYKLMREFFGLPIDGDSVKKSNASYVLKPLPKDGLSEKESPNGEWIMPACIVSKNTNTSPDKIKLFQVNEKIMEPDFRDGEHVMVDLSDNIPSPPGAFVVSDGFGTLIRQCEFVAGSKTIKD